MDWIPPELREDTGEIELAERHKLPNLIEIKDIKGDLHIHSNYPIEPSHDLGKNSISEMIQKAKQLEYEYIGFSEHNPSISKHTKKQIEKILINRNEQLEFYKKNNENIRIFKLLEVDILPNGDLPFDNSLLEILDAAIVSIHSSFSSEKSEMTERILKGLSHPKAKILGHPTGRIINERNGVNADWDKIFKFCAKNNKALEINAWPNRLDLSDVLIRKAIECKAKLIINTDAHATWQMNMIKYGVSTARRGWTKKSDILNTLPYNELMDWLNPTL